MGAPVSIEGRMIQFGGACFNRGTLDSFGEHLFQLRERRVIHFWGRLFQFGGAYSNFNLLVSIEDRLIHLGGA